MNREILIVDQTIREGMQHRGMMFNYEERLKIIQYQNQLGVDITQVAYPSAHKSEKDILHKIFMHCSEKSYKLKPAGHCRALLDDVRFLIESGINQFHIHSGISKSLIGKLGVDKIFSNLIDAVQYIRKNSDQPVIKVSLLDVGKTDINLLRKLSSYLIRDLEIDILTLPDTSGVMQPLGYYEIISDICKLTLNKYTKIGVHCHNDLGMAIANSIIGVLAGATVVEISALGIGERNGIGDLYIVSKILKREGYHVNLNTENIELFRAYYNYVNKLYLKQTGEQFLSFNTPYFGASTISHVAGTHGIGKYGLYTKRNEAQYFFNVLTGKNNLKNFSDNIGYDIDDIMAEKSVMKIKNLSSQKNRCLTTDEVKNIIQHSIEDDK